jgi:TctA family transporter
MDLLSNLLIGLQVVVTPINLLYVFIGCFLGTFIGVLPGIGPMATISMLLPATYGLPSSTAIIMLAGIYYGAQYGGSTTAILLNLPGESSSLITMIDGHQMSLKGFAGKALAAAALSSFYAGIISTIVLFLLSKPLSVFAFSFGPTEYVALMTLGLVGSSIFSNEDVLKSIGIMLIGILLGLVGLDVNSGVNRFDLNIPELSDGIGFTIIAIGIFGFSEIIKNFNSVKNTSVSKISKSNLKLNKSDYKALLPSSTRGTMVGLLLGMLPGGGIVMSAFSSYYLEKSIRLKNNEEALGTGNIRGVAGPEAANNAAAQISFIPLLSFGIPENGVMALVLGSMIMHGVQPGAQFITNNPQLYWGLIVSMVIGNLMLLILNLPLINIWVKILNVNNKNLSTSIILFCIIGVYSVNTNVMDIYFVLILGLFGYLLTILEVNPTPIMMGFILGPMLEENLRRALVISDGNWDSFITRPISGTIFGIILVIMILVFIRFLKKKVNDHVG